MICNNKNNCSFHDFFNNNPSLSILIGLLTALIPGLSLSEYSVSFIIILSLIILLLLSLFLNRKIILKILLWCIIGYIALTIKSYTVDNDYSSFFPRGDCGAQIQATLVDSGIIGKNVPWMASPKYLKMKISAIRFSDRDEWKKTYGLSNVYFSEKPMNLKYGELFQLNGCFIKPDKALIPGSFDYRHYLRSTGINRIFLCSKYKSLELQKFPYNIFRGVYLARDKALNLLCYGLESQKVKAFLAGFFFGCRQGLNSEIKQNFLRSGTIHILAISGLHIGVLTLILLIVLRPLPITVRYLIIPVLLLCYVSLTGFRPSGVRALLMISILCFHRAFFYSFSPINSIAFAAVVILLINPYSIGSLGFQFSFVVAGLLILSWEKVSTFLSVLSEKERWKVQNNFSLYVRLRKYLSKKIILLITTCIIAGVAGTGLVLYYQNLFIPLMFVTNIIILPLLLPLFLIGFLKIIITFSLGYFALLNYMLNGIVSFIFIITEFGALSCFTNYFRKPSIILLIFFYCILIFFFITKSSKKRIKSLYALTALFSFLILSNIFSSGFISVLQEKGNSPPVIIIKPNSHLNPIVVNCSKRLGNTIFNRLKQEGVDSIECIIMTGSGSKFSGGISYLIEKMKVKKLMISETIYKNKLYDEIIAQCKRNSIPITYISNLKKKKFSKINSNLKFQISNTEIYLKITEVNPGNKRVSIQVDNNKEKDFYFKNSNSNQIYESKV